MVIPTKYIHAYELKPTLKQRLIVRVGLFQNRRIRWQV